MAQLTIVDLDKMRQLVDSGLHMPEELAPKLLPELYSQAPGIAVLEVQDAMNQLRASQRSTIAQIPRLQEDEPMAEAFTEIGLQRSSLEKLDDRKIKGVMRELGIETRGRFNKESAIEKILAGKAEPNGNGKPHEPKSEAVRKPKKKSKTAADIRVVQDDAEPLSLEEAVSEDEDLEEPTIKPSRAKRKPVKVKLINPDENAMPFRIVSQAVKSWHPQLKDATFTLFWKFGWDKFGEVKKGDDTLRALGAKDFLLFLNHELWNSSRFTKQHMQYVVDDLLSRCQQELDREGDQKKDEDGRLCWRLIKPSVECFPGVISRHGFVTEELQRLAQAAFDHEDEERPLFAGLLDENDDSE